MSDHLERLEYYLHRGVSPDERDFEDIKAVCAECRKLRELVEGYKSLEMVIKDITFDDSDNGRFKAGVKHGAERMRHDVVLHFAKEYNWPADRTANAKALVDQLGPIRAPVPSELLQRKLNDIRSTFEQIGNMHCRKGVNEDGTTFGEITLNTSVEQVLSISVKLAELRRDNG